MAIGFVIDTGNCFGCKACQMACENEHLQRPGVFMRRVRLLDAGEGSGTVYVSMSCNHCDDPQCLRVCPVGAYTKMDDGTVVQDHEKCIGCKSCIMACPFHAPSFDEEEGATYKCDGCLARRQAGLEPRCVVTCPGGNIKFGETAQMAVEYGGTEAVRDVVATHPNLYVKLDEDLEFGDFANIDGAKTVDEGSIDGWLAGR